MKITYPALAATLLIPAFAFAEGIESNPIVVFIRDIIDFIDLVLVPLVFALALIAFLWGMFNYMILGGADEEKRDKGKQLAIWGIVAFFIMVSLWGIVNLLVGTFSFGGQNRPDIPTFNQQSGGTTFGGAGSSCEATIQCASGLTCIEGTCER